MIDSAIRFIRKNGRIIPIRAAAGPAAAVGASAGLRKVKPHEAVKPNRALQFGSVAAAVGGGIISGMSIGHGLKKMAVAHAVGQAADIASTGMTVGAFAGKGHLKQRAKGAAKLEVVNQVAGWATYGASAVAHKKGREAVARGASKVIAFARKAMRII